MSKASLRTRWLGKGALALTDQALIAGSNFMLGIVLARWLKPAQYGAYALAFSIFLLLSAFQQAILLEPMSVLAPSRYRAREARYLGILLWLEAGFGLLIMAALGVAGILAAMGGHRDLANAFAGLTIGAPCILLLWLARTACYVEFAAARSVRGAMLYCSILVCGLFAINRLGVISPFSVFVLMGFGALAASTLLLFQLRPAWRREARSAAHAGPSVREVWSEHWKYGRWAIGSSLLTWIPGNIFYAMTGAFLGMESTGALRALMNLTLPVAHAGTSMSNLFQPWVAGVYGREGAPSTRTPVKRVTLLYAGGALAWGVLCAAAGGPLFRLLYGGKFMQWSWLVPWVVLGAVFQLAAYGPSVGLRAIQSPSAVFAAYAGSAAVTLVLGFPALRVFGLAGVVGVSALSMLTTLVIAALLFRKRSAHRQPRIVALYANDVAAI